jgi:glutathione synthase/RimK-type ligase-like ATP-grasp enzyme
VTTQSGGRGPRIALASCAEHPEGLEGDALLAEGLAARGARVAWAVWDDPTVDWDAFDLVAVRATWDYPDHLDAFRGWVQTVAMSAELVNRPRTILGNLHKGYLTDLGPDAVPTVVVPAGMTVDMAALGWPSAVVKPAVGAGGHGVVRGATQRDLDALTLEAPQPIDVVVQPYLRSVEDEGEVSVVCIDGQPTHAVCKKPAVGEFRIHEHLGGTAERIPLRQDQADVARRMLSRLPMPPTIARVDLLEGPDGPLVGEIELVEPYLWLELAPEAGARLADSLVDRARATLMGPSGRW